MSVCTHTHVYIIALATRFYDPSVSSLDWGVLNWNHAIECLWAYNCSPLHSKRFTVSRQGAQRHVCLIFIGCFSYSCSSFEPRTHSSTPCSYLPALSPSSLSHYMGWGGATRAGVSLLRLPRSQWWYQKGQSQTLALTHTDRAREGMFSERVSIHLSGNKLHYTTLVL